ncbi:hypothetical protein SPRG_06818 [Saprolegnia parasitica CBS 223.65]|uniref:Uncharacterized protein n=1 Tax=Saprolegnia parasitica (strain CBS 223.65) TaxID=695850 RepID=A0A067CLW8_SAPPC|nr:hypothetical protein SPRG_06818 [Saprolegnia parasitica CBS 223.65]KDO27551.1 hypothetical protein SPRG_06818 [Saprolegnia parasitica CBS 223.65]|eukprot:XP_012201676.1 hypothetical protein SPRG_06818 [Saprolegnia parasitica CBS 223.65]
MAPPVTGTLSAVVRLRPETTLMPSNAAASPPVHRDGNGLALGRWEVSLTSYDGFAFYMAALCTCVPLAQINARIGLHRYWHVIALYGTLHVASWVLGYYWFLDSIWPNVCGRGLFDALSTPWTFGVGTSKSIAWYATLLLAIAYRIHLRWRLRRLFAIPGHLYQDAIATALCSCCVISQMAQHTTAYTPGELISIMPKDTLPGYEVL